MKERIPSMKRRCFCHDYRDRGIYMITLETAGRRPLLGRLAGENIEPTALGEAVASCWREISRFHPEIRLIESVVMPDHFHGLLFVTRRMGKHLGEVVRGFKIGCTRAYRAMYGAAPDGAAPYMAASLFASGYHDRILLRRGQLDTLIKYIRDNPRRLAVRRANPQFFTRVNLLRLGKREFAAYGNLFLLDRPDRLQVQCSRRITPEELAEKKAKLLEAAERGAVLVSPCISPGEKEIAHAALDEGLPLVVLLENGFPGRYKPPGRYFEACEAGRLLMLAPWSYHTEKRAITRAQCLKLNQMAKELGEGNRGMYAPAPDSAAPNGPAPDGRI